MDHGIGIYQGITFFADQNTDFLIIEYARGDE